MKPYFRAKGKYQDGRKRIVIEQEGRPSIAVPKPEILHELLVIIKKDYPHLIGRAKKQFNSLVISHKKWTGKQAILRKPLVNIK